MTNSSLVLLSGEKTTVPLAEARSLFLAYDEKSQFSSPCERVLICRSDADPFLIGSRIAFARRVGVLVEGRAEAALLLKGRRVAFRAFDLREDLPPSEPGGFLEGVDAEVDLVNPEFELTLVRADDDYLVVSSPGSMVQAWHERRPRRRPFFHPAAIFPKLSRALVNMTRVRAGEIFLDPFAGTGSLPLEAEMVGALCVSIDQAERMARGSLANMKHFRQEWLGAIRADSSSIPATAVDGIATDIPYGRASSTRGRSSSEVLGAFLPEVARLLRPGRILVLMHQKEVRVDGGGGFLLLEEHDLHVHKLLTRTITILRRK